MRSQTLNMKYSIIPAILEYTNEAIIRKLELASTFSNHLHIDIIDESFSDKTILPHPQLFAPYTSELFLELHMMVKDPKRLVTAYSVAGFKRFLGHIEYMPDQKEFITLVTGLQKEAFLALDLETSTGALEQGLESNLQGLLCMDVAAGKSGQPFNGQVLKKIEELRRRFPDSDIEVDGGIDDKSILQAKESGANIFAATSAIFMQQSPASAYQNLERALAK